MYFSEQGNVDDDATLITIFLVSFNLQSSLQSAVCSLWSAVCSLQSPVCSLQSAVCGLQSAVCSLWSAVCSLQMSYTATVAVCSLGFSLLIGFHSNISNIP